MNRVLSVGVGAALLLCATELRAQDTRDLEARRLYEAGEVAFRSGRYEDALERFRDAYELSERPELLYNIASTAERLRRDEEALDGYRRYLDALPTAHNRDEVAARIQILERSLDASEAEAEATEPEEPTEEPRSAIGVSTWLLGSTTVLATLLGVTARLLGNAEYDDLYDDCVRRGGCTDEEVEGSSVRRWDRVTVASFAVAGAALVGTVLSIALRPSSSPDEPALSLMVGPQRVALQGRF